MVSLGITALPYYPPSVFLDVARAADEAGLDEVWLWEDCFFEGGVSAAGAILGATQRVRVGVGVMPVPLRNVALTAMEIATLAGMFPGRLRPGVGHGIQDWMAQVGAKAGSPLTLLREHLTALRALLDGQTVSTSGRYVTLDGVKLSWPPAVRLPLLCAGEGPKTLRLVGELADGVVLTGQTGDTLAQMLDTVNEARAAAGREDEPFDVVNILGLPDDAMDKGAQWAADQIRAQADAGVTTVQCTAGEADPVAVAHWLATEVRPLV